MAKLIELAQVGRETLTTQDIDYKQKVEGFYQEGSASPLEGTIIRLISDALHREVAHRNKIEPASAEEVLALEQHVSASGRGSTLLVQIQNAFGEDKDAYTRIFLSPKIVPPKLREFFAKKKERVKIHENVKKAFDEVRSGTGLPDAAEKYGLSLQELVLQEPDLPSRPGMPPRMDAPESPMLMIARFLRIGELHDTIIETRQKYLIVQLKAHKKTKYTLQIASGVKPDFDDWFHREAGKIPIHIRDNKFRKKVKEKYSDLWWVKNIKGAKRKAKGAS